MLQQEPDRDIADVAEILRDLREEVRQQRQVFEGLPSPDRDETTGLRQPAFLTRVHEAAHVNAHLPIAWPTWPKGLRPKVVALARKVARRSLRWYINPIVEQQNHFNTAVARALEHLWQEMDRLQRQFQQDGDDAGPETDPAP